MTECAYLYLKVASLKYIRVDLTSQREWLTCMGKVLHLLYRCMSFSCHNKDQNGPITAALVRPPPPPNFSSVTIKRALWEQTQICIKISSSNGSKPYTFTVPRVSSCFSDFITAAAHWNLLPFSLQLFQQRTTQIYIRTCTI